MSTPAPHAYARLWRALISLEGLSIGDAFGEHLLQRSPHQSQQCFNHRAFPESEQETWNYTGETQMALSLVEQLRRAGSIEQDQLVAGFVQRYEPTRAYQPVLQELLLALQNDPRSWQARALTSPQSLGALACMAPLGAFFADDLGQVILQTQHSVQTIHHHPEAIAGAIAIAVAAALAWRAREKQKRLTGPAFLESILARVPESEVRRKLQLARHMASSASAREAAALLGSSQPHTSQDTVPYILWCTGQFLDDYQEALWQTSSGAEELHTTCAIVGGILALAVGVENIPEAWLQRREALPLWVIDERS